MLRTAALILLLSTCGVSSAYAQEGVPKAPSADHARQTPPANGSAEVADQSPAKQSDAERITRLQRTIEDDEKLLKELNAKLDDPEGEYSKAEAEFKSLDEELEAKRQELQGLKDEGKADQAAALQAEIEPLQQRWKLSKDRFDLAIQEHKTLQEQIGTLQQKIQQDREALNKLLAPPATQPAAAPSETPTTTPAQPTGQAEAAPEAAEPAPQTTPAPAVPGVPALDAAPGKPGQEPAPEPPSKELLEAQQEALLAETEAREAEQEVRSITERIDQLRKQIDLEKTALETARRKADNAQETQRTLSEQVQKRSSEGAPQAELQELWSKIADARQRDREARAEVTERVNRIDELQVKLAELQGERITALREAEEKREKAAETRKVVDWRKSPFYPPRLLQWLIEKGPRVLGILVGIVVLLWLARVAERRIVRVVAARGGPGTPEDRENRAKTLVSVFHHTATWVIVIGGIFMVMAEVGVPIVPLMGGAAVVGLAVAFGAQNLVRDYFSGFMILLESQYGINDVIKIGGVAGLVERVTLRVTVLRDLEGTVHFVPNGQIATVSNMTHGWSRALFAIGVAYKEDVDRVMKVLVDLAKELRADPAFQPLILDDPEMLGLDSFDDSAVIIKFFIKTRPLKQWTVKRELLRRIKNRFDELGIEIPFPHRTIYHRYEEEGPPVPGVEKIRQTMDQV